MHVIKCILSALLADESGQDLIEYALVAALIALGVVISMQSLAAQIGTAFTDVSSELSSAL